MLGLVLSFVVTIVLGVSMYIRAKTKHLLRHSENIPGPAPLPLVGNALSFGLDVKGYLDHINKLVATYPPVTRVWLGPILVIALYDPKHVEAVINSSKNLQKAFAYRPLHPWLGMGLLTSAGAKWKSHRKFLTPTFHFKILEQFVEVFNANGNVLVQRLASHVNGPKFDVCSYITMCTLDVISESTMGVKINAQSGNNKEYVEAIRRMGEITVKRGFKPWLLPDILFQLTSLSRVQRHSLSVLHGMTNSVIKNRRKELAERKTKGQEIDKENDIGRKRQLAFLDLLIESSEADGGALTDEEIREEVDTFMFEGHDTTSSGIAFTLWNLAHHQDVQVKAAEELKRIFGDSDRDAKLSDLQDMKYIEQVIKESLRLYPSVPLFGRELSEDVSVDGYVFPAGASVMFLPYNLHRNPQYFPDPEKFDPERFSHENSVGRHPYSYIPFAAGPRNCIGQKFAMLELKSIVSKMLRKFRLHPGNPNEKLKLIPELVLKSDNGVQIKLQHRD